MVVINWFRRLFAPPVFEDEEKTRISTLLHVIALTMLLVSLVGTLSMAAVATDPIIALLDLTFGVVTAVFMVGLLFLTRRGYLRIAGVLCSVFLLVMVTATLFGFKGIRNPTAVAYFVVIAIAALLLGGRAAVIFGVASALAALGVYYAELNGLLLFAMPPSVELFDWFLLTSVLGVATILLRYAVRGIAEGFERSRRHVQELAGINRELTISQETLQAQARALERRARYLEATAAVAREAVSMLGLQDLLTRIVALIGEQFGFYHVSIFLIDPSGEWAELCAASSEGGQRMLARGHRLRVREQGIVGYVTGYGEARIALDVGKDAVYFDNPDLSQTRSEVALPLRVAGRIIGALDVQSTEPAAFIEEDVTVLQTLADQVAMAIHNARLFHQVQEALETERKAYGEVSREGWAQLIQAWPTLGFYRDQRGLFPIEKMEREDALPEEMPDEGDGAKRTVPIKVRGQIIGTIEAYRSEGTSKWLPEEIALLETLSEQVGAALESARLYQDSRRRAAREQLIGEIAARLTASTQVESILETTVQELGRIFEGSEVVLQLGSDHQRRKETV